MGSCIYCRISLSGKYRITPPTGHTEETIPGYAATCTEPGLTDGKECTVCWAVTLVSRPIPAKGHHFHGGWFANGSNTHLRYCTRGCGYHVSAECVTATFKHQTKTLTICPLCGRQGEIIIRMTMDASLVHPDGDADGELIVQVIRFPEAEDLSVITVVYESNGQMAELPPASSPFTFAIPLWMTEPGQLLLMNADATTVPIAYTVENGHLMLTVHQPGIFLLMSE